MTDHPANLFALPPGADFAKCLVDGLVARFSSGTPTDLAKVTLIVNTRRMARRIRDIFDAGPPMLLPRICLISDLQGFGVILPESVPKLERRLELIQLVSALLDQRPELASRTSLFALSDSLASLFEEMNAEGVPFETLQNLDVSQHSDHWKRSLDFIKIVHGFQNTEAQIDQEQRQRMLVERLIEIWDTSPPQNPIVIAGSTGSRATGAMLIKAIAQLPTGMAVLPGFDFEMPASAWSDLNNPMTSQDHPQYRFNSILNDLNMSPASVRAWVDNHQTDRNRNKVVSLALRPAPVTDCWLSEGPDLPDLSEALKNISLIEAPTQRSEAVAIALCLRQASHDGKTAALITPDRMLTRHVASVLDFWNIIPDDSAGAPLQLTPPGRFLRHVSDLFKGDLDSDTLLTILKHPICHSGGSRGTHLLLTRELELFIRKKGVPFPKRDDLDKWLAKQKDPFANIWVNWIDDCFLNQADAGTKPLTAQLTHHIELAEIIAAGSAPDTDHELWNENTGRTARAVLDGLLDASPLAGDLSLPDYLGVFHSVISSDTVRDRDAPDENILIWGTLEARVQGADLVILGGLNEGSWPEASSPDPWLNRTLRHQAGLLLPDRNIGLSAHDFQQAVGAPEVILSRSIRSDDAETVTSRWIYRITNLLGGLPDNKGVAALKDMRKRGQYWVKLGETFEKPDDDEPAPRPSPAPPRATRPKQLPVTDVSRLIRDPYAIYAKRVLGLRPLNPVMRGPDPMLRGTVLHKVFENFIRSSKENTDLLSANQLIEFARIELETKVPWADIRLLWQSRIERIAGWFIDQETARRKDAQPIAFEIRGAFDIPDLGFTLTAEADRIDKNINGELLIYDYKTGPPPSAKSQTHFDKQLLLEAVMAENGAFNEIVPTPVMAAIYIGLGSNPKEQPAPLQDEPVDHILERFKMLIAEYMDPSKGFAARRAMLQTSDTSDYEHLSRFGEWDITQDAKTVALK